MKKYYYLLIACFGLLTIQAQTLKNGSYEYSLTDIDYNKLPSWIDNDYGKWEHLAPKNEYRFTSEGIVLTIKRTSATAFAITDLNLDLRKGAKFEFEYAMASVTYDGPAEAGYGGGGMTFFIYDANKPLKMGYLASALGYSFNGETAGGSTAISQGLNGAYLGIGFDLDGNNKERKGYGMGSYETREGLSHLRYENAGFKDGMTALYFGRYVFNDYYKNHITLRAAGQGDGYKGNPLMLTKYFGGKNSSNGIAMATLDYNSGEYNFSGSNNGDVFNIADGGTDSKPKFQKIEVELIPNGEAGMYVTVKGNGKILIDRFYYQHSFKTYGDGKGKDEDYVDYQYNYNSSIPNKVNIGFVGTTMDNNTQKTIIRNLKVTPGVEEVEEPELEDIDTEMCVSDSGNSKDGVIDVRVLQNTGYKVGWGSFMFVDKNGNKIGDRTYEDSTGKWEFSSGEEEITFTIKKSWFEPGDEADIYYSIELDGVRSKPALFRIKGIACGAVVNPHIRSKAGEK